MIFASTPASEAAPATIDWKSSAETPPEQEKVASSPPGASAYIPDVEPANDPHGLPYQAALAFDRGLMVGRRYYDALMPNQNYGLCALPGG